MSISSPYSRICRPYINGYWINGTIEKEYFIDSRYASDANDLRRAYRLLEDDLLRIFDFIEPADANLDCYSHQLYTLLLRACTEFETNAKAILIANGYSSGTNWTIKDFWKINQATRLNEYYISIPIWSGNHKTFSPFSKWSNSHSLVWYQNYNDVKHHRSGLFPSASLRNVINAIGGVLAVLFAQFSISAFDPYHLVTIMQENNGFFSHEKCLLEVLPSITWSSSEQYDFDWSQIANSPNPFQRFIF